MSPLVNGRWIDETVLSRSIEAPPIDVKSTGVAVILSFFWTGLGQLYAGKIWRGIVMVFATPIMWFMMISNAWGEMMGFIREPTHLEFVDVKGWVIMSIYVPLALLLGWWIAGMYDAKKMCDAHNRRVWAAGRADRK